MHRVPAHAKVHVWRPLEQLHMPRDLAMPNASGVRRMQCEADLKFSIHLTSKLPPASLYLKWLDKLTRNGQKPTEPQQQRSANLPSLSNASTYAQILQIQTSPQQRRVDRIAKQMPRKHNSSSAANARSCRVNRALIWPNNPRLFAMECFVRG